MANNYDLFCSKCKDVTKHSVDSSICLKCGYASEPEVDFIKTQEQDLDLLK